MAVVPMQRINIFALRKDGKKILETLQRLGVVEICDVMKEGRIYKKVDVSDAASQLNMNIRAAGNALEILNTYAPEKKSMFASFNGPEEASSEDYDEFAGKRAEVNRKVRKIVALSKTIQENKAETIKINLQIESLEPWTNLDVPMTYAGSKSTAAFIGVLPGNWDEEMIYSQFAEFAPLDVEIISVVREQTNVFIMCMKEHYEKMFEQLRMKGYARPVIQTKLSPSEQMKEYTNAISAIDAETEEAENAIKAMADSRSDIKFFEDYELMRQEKYDVTERILQTDHTILITGYIPKPQAEAVKKYLEDKFTVEIQLKEPSKKAEPPVLLQNNGFARPVQSVTEGFSPPGPGEIDPTSIMSIYFYLLFGVMFSDAGYGFMLALICGIVLLKFPKMQESTRNFIKMFFFCGLATLFWGIIFSSYFGDAVNVISATFFGKEVGIPPVWFSPTEEPMRMLVFSVCFGIVHIYTALIIKFYQYVKQKKILDGIYDSIFWLVLLSGLIMLMMSSQMFMGIIGVSLVLPPIVGTIGTYMAAVAAVGVVLTAGRESKSPFKRLLKGLYGLYGVSSYLNDVLSYSRLLALGLATGVIGSVINKMGSMFGSGIFKAIIFILVFIIGHILNFLINILGAYVHTTRLQYVEFFGKFYDGGGRKFAPFSAKTKYYKIKEK